MKSKEELIQIMAEVIECGFLHNYHSRYTAEAVFEALELYIKHDNSKEGK